MTRIALLCAVLAAGCGVEVAGHEEGDDPAAAYSATGQQIIAALQDGHARARGKTWDLAEDNTLAAGWLIDSPVKLDASSLPVATSCAGSPGCDPDFDLVQCTSQADCTHGGTCAPVRATVATPGGEPRSLCVGHSDAMVDQIYDLVAGAQSLVDISSLTPPDGRFEAALRNAFSVLAHSGRDVRVRYVYAAIPGASLGAVATPDDVIAGLVRELPAGSPLRITVAQFRGSIDTWDHAKVLAIDHRTVMVGGHNWLTRHYLQSAPVSDLSMQVTGSAAVQATRYTDALWSYVCKGGSGLASVATVVAFPAESNGCDTAAPEFVEAAPQSGDTRIISVGRLGELGDNASDDALVALIDAAQTRLRISQQDLGGLAHDWPMPIVGALTRAAQRGVEIELVMSNVNAAPDHLIGGTAAYSNGWTPADVEHELTGAGVPCERLSVASLRHGSADRWPDGTSFANHAKLVIADEAAFYLGSQNLYPSNLTEYGFIVDDETATRQVIDGYFTKVWTDSKRAMASCE